MVSADPAKPWGIRSLATGSVYLWARSQDFAEMMQAGTGRPDAYEVVQLVERELCVHETRPTAPPIPEFARKPVDSVGEDEEIVRLAVVLRDPLYGVKIPSMTVTAAELRERAEQELRANPLRWHWYRLRIWWWHWRRSRKDAPAL